ncbi:hypothetical protein Pelo_1868 [Pelomyxa schiedti]|nr:hypothetical protein Pelo_1868 [Pelomyxa schiedti]
MADSGGFELRRGVLGALPAPTSGKWNAILVGDLHLTCTGDSYFTVDAQKQALEDLQKVVATTRTDQLIVLGDVFHQMSGPMARNVQNKEFFLSTVNSLCTACNSVYIIGGNHDRFAFQLYRSSLSTIPNLQYSPKELLCLTSTNGSKAYLTHDGGNGLWIAKEQVTPFIQGLRAINELTPHDLMVCAHVHQPTDLRPATSSVSIGTFTALSGTPTTTHQYALLQEDDGGRFTLALQST